MRKNLLSPGEKVRHKARAEWGVGEITTVHTCGTVGVVFEGNRILSIAKGINFLKKVDVESQKV